MKNHSFQARTALLLPWILLLASMYCLFHTYVIDLSRNIGLILNNDVITYTMAAHNVVYQHGSLLNWHFFRVFYLFPDITVLLLSNLFFTTPYPNFLTYAAFQIIAFCVLLAILFKNITQTSVGSRLGVLMVFLFVIFLRTYHEYALYTTNEFITAIYVPSFHFGSTLVTFAALACLISVLKNDSIRVYSLLSTLIILGGISDALTHVYFTLPALVTLSILYALKYIRIKKYLKITGLLLTLYFLITLIPEIIPLPVSPLNAHRSFKLLHLLEVLKAMEHILVQRHPFLGILWFTFFITTPFSLRKTLLKPRHSSWMVDAILLYEWVLVVSSFVVLWAYAGTMYDIIDQSTEVAAIPTRYMIPLILGPCFLGLPLLLYKHAPFIQSLQKDSVFYGLLCICTTCMLLFHNHKPTKEYYLHFYPPSIACFDQAAKNWHLHSGISFDLFISRYITNYNQSGNNGIMVGHVLYNLNPFLYLGNDALYQQKTYDFVISTDPKDLPILLKYFGKPNHEMACHDNDHLSFKIYAYTNGAMRGLFQHTAT